MAESITSIVDEKTKRKQKINSVYIEEKIKKRLNQSVNSHVVYEGTKFENLEIIRKKLKHTTDGNLQIRGNKIYEIRRRLTKLELIRKTIKETVQILKEKEMINSDKNEDDLTLLVYNKFLGGTEKRKYTIKSAKQDII